MNTRPRNRIECAVEVVRVKYAVVGGDMRAALLCAMLAREGARVYSFALEKAEMSPQVIKAGCMQGCVYAADCVILPVPTERGGLLVTPMSDSVIRMSELISALWPGQVIIGGHLSDASCAQAQREGLCIEDMLLRPDYVMGNAALTAEGAVMRLMEEGALSLMGRAILICGWGRIGRLLAQKLGALGARVTIAARGRDDRAQARAMGFSVLDYSALETELPAFSCIVNTVPARVLTDAMLCMAAEGAIIMELASPPGGFDRVLAENIGLHVVSAPGLPGVCAAQSAAELMKSEIYAILGEQEE